MWSEILLALNPSAEAIEAIMRDQERRFVMGNIRRSDMGETQGEKPRICEVLGVEVGEEWRATDNDVATYRINEDGEFEYAMPLYSRPGHGGWLRSDVAHLLDFIAHPDRIIRQPRFTADEVATMRVLKPCGINYLCRNKTGSLSGRDAAPTLDGGDWKSNGRVTEWLPTKLFPTLERGRSIRIQDIIDC